MYCDKTITTRLFADMITPFRSASKSRTLLVQFMQSELVRTTNVLRSSLFMEVGVLNQNCGSCSAKRRLSAPVRSDRQLMLTSTAYVNFVPWTPDSVGLISALHNFHMTCSQTTYSNYKLCVEPRCLTAIVLCWNQIYNSVNGFKAGVRTSKICSITGHRTTIKSEQASGLRLESSC